MGENINSFTHTHMKCIPFFCLLTNPSFVTLSAKSSLSLGENKAGFRRESHICHCFFWEENHKEENENKRNRKLWVYAE